MKLLLLALALCLFLTGCTESTERNAATSEAAEPVATEIVKPKINWFAGDVSSAFTLARETDKPVFLYWGAVWCPPCQEIKHTVFKSRRFITQTGSFIPVYLDGDTDEAQAEGERFGVRGYPTMIVFNPDGEEVTRIPGGIDISAYNDVLELALNSISPTATLVQRVITAPDVISKADIKQLAFYSWGQDHSALPDNYDPELFLAMSRLAQDDVSSARLYMQYLIEVSSAFDRAQDKARHSSADPLNDTVATIVPVTGAFEKVSSILDSDTLTLACWDSIAHNPKLLPHIAPEDARHDLSIRWQKKTLDLSNDPSLSVSEQLTGLLPTLTFFFIEDETRDLTPELKQTVLEATTAADRATTNSFARQSVVNKIGYILKSAHLIDEAKQLFLAELQRSESPYYFMSSLASIAEDQGNITEAIQWHQKAYESSVGTATRFQWGASYVKALIRLRPEEDTLIFNTSIALISELEQTSGVFAGRNFRRLVSLNTQLNNWQPGKEPALLADFNEMITHQCTAQIEGSLEAENCRSLKDGASESS
ncbi:MAG: thioredoxin fold domain-containing protein [bacterium]